MGLAQPRTWPGAHVHEQAIFTELYDRHLTAVYSYARNRIGESDAEDLTAEVFLAAVKAIRGGNKAIDAAWLIGVARNKVIDNWRRRTVRSAKLHLVASRHVELPPDWVDGGVSGHVMTALESITSRHRSVLMMQAVHGMAVKEIASQTGDSISSTESLLRRAKVAFRQAYLDAESGSNE